MSGMHPRDQIVATLLEYGNYEDPRVTARGDVVLTGFKHDEHDIRTINKFAVVTLEGNVKVTDAVGATITTATPEQIQNLLPEPTSRWTTDDAVASDW